MCVAGHFLHIHQDSDAAAVQAESRPGEIYRLQIQVPLLQRVTDVTASKSRRQETCLTLTSIY